MSLEIILAGSVVGSGAATVSSFYLTLFYYARHSKDDETLSFKEQVSRQSLLTKPLAAITYPQYKLSRILQEFSQHTYSEHKNN